MSFLRMSFSSLSDLLAKRLVRLTVLLVWEVVVPVTLVAVAVVLLLAVVDVQVMV